MQNLSTEAEKTENDEVEMKSDEDSDHDEEEKELAEQLQQLKEDEKRDLKK